MRKILFTLIPVNVNRIFLIVRKYKSNENINQNNEILIYRFMDRNGDLLPEKTAKKPVRTHTIHYKHLSEVTDIFIFKRQAHHNEYDSDEYCMYVLFKDGIILFNGVERRNDQVIVLD